MKIHVRVVAICLSGLLILGCSRTRDRATARNAYYDGMREYEAKDYPSAARDYRKAVKLDPSVAVYHDGLGLALLHQGQNAEARKEFKEAVRIKPSRSIFHADVARADIDLRNIADAELEAKEAISLEPTSAYCNYYLAFALNAEGKYLRAFDPARKAAVIDVKNAACQELYGTVLWGLGRYKEAQVQLKEACRISPTSGHYRLRLAQVDALAGDYEATVADAQAATKLGSKDAVTYNILGVGNFFQKHYSAALTAYKKAVHLEPNVAQWHMGLGSAEYRLGDKAAAMRDWAVAAKAENPGVRSKAEQNLKNPESS